METITIPKFEFENIMERLSVLEKKFFSFEKKQKEKKIKDKIVEELKTMNENDFLSEKESNLAFENLLKNAENVQKKVFKKI